jgi:predicted nucleic acid-binding protein
MRNECFLDTNILIYAAAGREDEPDKYRIAEKIVRTADFCLSGQVLAEFYVNILRKPLRPPPLREVDQWITYLQAFPVAPIDTDLVRAGIIISRRFRIGYWDAAIIAAAEFLDAEVVYTEDLNHGQRYGSVRIVNPFNQN